jgi:hypothetical protein
MYVQMAHTLRPKRREKMTNLLLFYGFQMDLLLPRGYNKWSIENK